MLALEIYGLLVLGGFLLIGWIVVRPILAAWLYKHFSDPDPYPPEAAEAPTLVGVDALRANEEPHVVGPDPVDEHFSTLPRIDSAEVDRLVAGFDWPRYATWLKEPS